MPIKEEPVRIEFQYEQEDAGTSDGVFSVEYFSETEDGKEKKYVRVTPHGTTENSIFELDFLVEVVDFLRKKGVVEDKVEEQSVPDGQTPRSVLPLPNIQLAKNSSHILPVGASTASETTVALDSNFNKSGIPISTFITNGVEPQILSSPVVSSSQSIAAPKVISAPEAGSPMPVITRPVIRTIVKENEDPMTALEESKRQRKVNTEKTIKRKEE